MTLVTQATFAKICNTTRKTVTMWKKKNYLQLQGDKVDVDATAAYMKRFHRTGSPIVLSPLEIADLIAVEGNKSAGGKREGNNKAATLTQPVTPESNAAGSVMTVGDVEAQLLALDWTQQFDWTPGELDRRVRLAAQCIGWETVTSSVIDDSHWDGYQLRIPKYMTDGLHEGAVVGGFGYELDAFDVLKLVREHISVRKDEDGSIVQDDCDEIEIQPALIPLLARPFGDTHTRKS
ncbi:hypothetical protein PQR65_05300 [Paraburkholderia nemoris]|uniref:hypothetical protein n=1 Tax=Paraburkholderia nemoris TaxID=2793076 RepID=UPI0038B7D52B